jgi:hypothetical protein
MKKDYEAPVISELGSVEAFTQGPGGGRLDSFFGIGDGDGGWRPGGGGGNHGGGGFS